jgi:hypothetical protein
MKFAAAIPVAALLVSGCASTNSWQNPGLAADAAARQLQIDTAECEAGALQAVALPSPASPPAGPSSYELRGQINGTPYTASVTPSDSGGFDPARSVAEGAAFAQQLSAIRLRRQLAQACMLKRGWQLTRG